MSSSKNPTPANPAPADLTQADPTQADRPSVVEVETGIRAHLREKPDDVASIHDLGIIAYRHGRAAEAIHLLRQAHALAPHQVALLRSLGQVLCETGDAAGGIEAYAKVLDIDPKDDAVWNAMGVALQRSGQPARAMEAYLRALAIEPERTETLNNAGILLYGEKDLDGALAMFEQALAIDAAMDGAHSNMGVLYRDRLQYKQAAASFHRAWELLPTNSEYAGALGEVLSLVYDNEAEGILRRAVDLEPESAERHFNLSIELLRHGKYAEGFREYEWRWKRGHGHNTPRDYPQPYWHGEDAHGQTVLVYHEQGLGDTLQMLRYLPLLTERGSKVVLDVQPELRALVAERFGAELSVLNPGEAPPAFDWHIGMMSLPMAFGTTLESVSSPVMLRDVRRRDGVRRVGLAWAGNAHHARDRERSLQLDWLTPLLQVSGVEWVSLQVGPAVMQLTGIRTAFDVPLLENFTMTADVIETLDLVICVDSAVAHLAGSMGVPTWLLLPYVADWRWLGPENSLPASSANPWYPAMRIFRQTSFPETNDQRERWQPVIEAMVQELELWR